MGKRRGDDGGKPAILTQMTAPYLWRRLHLREQFPLSEHRPDPNCSGCGERGSKRNSWQRAHISVDDWKIELPLVDNIG
jgi:hypothetical protein